MATNSFKCFFCKECNGYGCKGQLPGMGGVNNSHNFIENCKAWKSEREQLSDEEIKSLASFSIKGRTGIAPVTGAIQNIGFEKEEDFYIPYFKEALFNEYFISVGDGAPDEKLILGTEAVKQLNQKAYFFLKPYPNEILKQRINLVKPFALGIGMDIDAYNIVTMRNQVHLEKKTPEQIFELKEYMGNIPLMLKGIFTQEDLELCKKVKPDIAVISNHGGRVETEQGSSCQFLKNYGKELKEAAGEVWVDGGIRNDDDVRTAILLGADRVLIGRPVISAVCKKFRIIP